jgi:hypothetical protein
VILAVVTSVLVINFNQCDSECRRPRISDAMESGRKAAFVILTGTPENSGLESSWLYPAPEKVKNLKGFHLPASKLETLTREAGIQATAPLLAETDNLEPVALDTWENAVVITYKYEISGETVEVAGKGPLLIAVSLQYAYPEESSLEIMRDRIFPSSWVLSSRWLVNLGKKRGHWKVFDFVCTGTLNEYLEQIHTSNGQPPPSSSELDSELRADLSEIEPIARADADFTEKWSHERSTYQMRRFQQTREEWSAVEETVKAMVRQK